MAKYHINPATGNPNICTAAKKCRFGDEATHYPTEANARQAYELSMGPGAQAARDAQQALDAASAPNDEAYDEMMNQGREPLDDFQSILTTLTRDDIAYGIDRAGVLASNAEPKTYGFVALMGDVRRTVKQETIYQRKLRGMVASEAPLRLAAFQVAEEKAKVEVWGRAFERGVPIDPVMDTHFKDIWAGKEMGFSREATLEEAQRAQELDNDFRAGKISSRQVVGTGLINPDRMAREYLDARLIKCGRNLATEGRSNSVNVSNAIRAAKNKGLHPSTPGF